MTTALCFIPFFKSKIGFPTNLIGKTNLQCGPRTRLVRDIVLNINSFFVANSVAESLGKVGERASRKLLIRLQICLWPKMLGLYRCTLFIISANQKIALNIKTARVINISYFFSIY